jgi:hypothetical protein
MIGEAHGEMQVDHRPFTDRSEDIFHQESLRSSFRLSLSGC